MYTFKCFNIYAFKCFSVYTFKCFSMLPDNTLQNNTTSLLILTLYLSYCSFVGSLSVILSLCQESGHGLALQEGCSPVVGQVVFSSEDLPREDFTNCCTSKLLQVVRWWDWGCCFLAGCRPGAALWKPPARMYLCFCFVFPRVSFVNPLSPAVEALQFLNHWITREVPVIASFLSPLSSLHIDVSSSESPSPPLRNHCHPPLNCYVIWKWRRQAVREWKEKREPLPRVIKY